MPEPRTRPKALGLRLESEYTGRIEAICAEKGWTQTEALRRAIRLLDRQVFGRRAPDLKPIRMRKEG